MEYVTKKVPKSLVPVIRDLQAEYTLARGRRVTEAQVIAEAVEELARKPAFEKKRFSLSDLRGTVRTKVRSNAALDADEVIYGDVNRT